MISDFNVASASRTIAVLYSGGTHYDAMALSEGVFDSAGPSSGAQGPVQPRSYLRVQKDGASKD
eukprot:5679279-Amphidinium_carterae.1